MMFLRQELKFIVVMSGLGIALSSCAPVDDSIGEFKAQFRKPDETTVFNERGLPTPSPRYTQEQKKQLESAFGKELDTSAAHRRQEIIKQPIQPVQNNRGKRPIDKAAAQENAALIAASNAAVTPQQAIGCEDTKALALVGQSIDNVNPALLPKNYRVIIAGQKINANSGDANRTNIVVNDNKNITYAYCG